MHKLMSKGDVSRGYQVEIERLRAVRTDFLMAAAAERAKGLSEFKTFLKDAVKDLRAQLSSQETGTKDFLEATTKFIAVLMIYPEKSRNISRALVQLNITLSKVQKEQRELAHHLRRSIIFALDANNMIEHDERSSHDGDLYGLFDETKTESNRALDGLTKILLEAIHFRHIEKERGHKTAKEHYKRYIVATNLEFYNAGASDIAFTPNPDKPLLSSGSKQDVLPTVDLSQVGRRFSDVLGDEDLATRFSEAQYLEHSDLQALLKTD